MLDLFNRKKVERLEREVALEKTKVSNRNKFIDDLIELKNTFKTERNELRESAFELQKQVLELEQKIKELESKTAKKTTKKTSKKEKVEGE